VAWSVGPGETVGVEEDALGVAVEAAERVARPLHLLCAEVEAFGGAVVRRWCRGRGFRCATCVCGPRWPRVLDAAADLVEARIAGSHDVERIGDGVVCSSRSTSPNR
jgi:hypothetical protein